MIKYRLKGGSLSSTYLCENTNKQKFVRKEISLTQNREYGFVRWYSQLKKLQRYENLSSKIFPKILSTSFESNYAYFDIEYMNGYKDIKQILTDEVIDNFQIEKIVNAFCNALDVLHKTKLNKIPGSPWLYYKEEVDQKILDAISTKEFSEFYELKKYSYNGLPVNGIQVFRSQLEKFFQNLEFETEELTHGNPTLENSLYSFVEDKVIFVDPYEEGIIDSKFLDYSQVLQCSRSGYGYINDRSVKVQNNFVSFDYEIPENFKKFNDLFVSKVIESKYRYIIDVLEATQFIRMLPFKCYAGDIDKAKYFYVHACYLLEKAFTNDFSKFID